VGNRIYSIAETQCVTEAALACTKFSIQVHKYVNAFEKGSK